MDPRVDSYDPNLFSYGLDGLYQNDPRVQKIWPKHNPWAGYPRVTHEPYPKLTPLLKSLLLKKLAICWVLQTKGMQTTPLLIFSFIKCLLCCTVFWVILIATLLSQYNFIGIFTDICNSSKILFSHNISQTLLAITLYSTPTLLLTTTFCFLLCHVIILS